MFRGEYITQVDPDLCVGCRECLSLCQFGAVTYSAANHRAVVITFGLRRDAKNKELEATFQLKVRAIQPQREILNDLLEIEGVKAVNLA